MTILNQHLNQRKRKMENKIKHDLFNLARSLENVEMIEILDGDWSRDDKDGMSTIDACLIILNVINMLINLTFHKTLNFKVHR